MNLLPFPKELGENEWFLIVALVVFSMTILFLPKRFPISLTILIMVFSSVVARVSDHILAGTNLDLYDVMDSGKYDFFDIISYLLYPPFAYLFVYFYFSWRISGLAISLYILLWSIGGVAFESLAVYFKVFTYKGWSLKYSFLLYLVIQTATLVFFHFLKKSYAKGF